MKLLDMGIIGGADGPTAILIGKTEDIDRLSSFIGIASIAVIVCVCLIIYFTRKHDDK